MAGNRKFILRPVSYNEAGLFYAIPTEQNAVLGTFGHVHIEFGSDGNYFYCHTWYSRRPEAVNDVIAIGERLEDYVLVPEINTDREMGVSLVESGVEPFSESVRPYLDYGKIGTEYYADHGGAYISCGYVLRKGSADQALQDFTQPHPAQEFGGMNMT